MNNEKPYETMKSLIEKDPTASYFLKDMLFEADRRDPVDVIADCETLISIMKQSVKESTVCD